MKNRKIIALIMVSVFCLSSCSTRYKDIIEQDINTEQVTTASSAEEETDETTETEDSDEPVRPQMPDMSEKWDVRYGGEQYCQGSPYLIDAYSFSNESGFMFSCTVFMPKEAKEGEKFPVVLMNSGLRTTGNITEVVDEETGQTTQLVDSDPSNREECLLGTALNEENIGLIVIEPFGSLAVTYMYFDDTETEGGDLAEGSAKTLKGYYFNNTYKSEEALIDVVLDNLGNISGADPSRVVLASRDYHNIAATGNAARNQEKFKGLIMIDPSADLIEKIRNEYPDKESLKDVYDPKAGMGLDYMYEIYDLDLKEESSKLSTNTKVFIGKDKSRTDYTDPNNDRGIVNNTLANSESAESIYPNCDPEIVDTTSFIYTNAPSEETKNSINKIVTSCKIFLQQR